MFLEQSAIAQLEVRLKKFQLTATVPGISSNFIIENICYAKVNAQLPTTRNGICFSHIWSARSDCVCSRDHATERRIVYSC